MEEHHYLIRGGIAGRERLRVLARVMRPGTLALLERVGQQLVLGVEQGRERAVDGRLAVGGQPDDHAAAVVGVGEALDEAPGGEPVDPVRHGAAGHQRLLDQPPGGELVVAAGPAERGQDVELPQLDRELRERVAARQVEVPREPGDAAEDRDGRQVEVGALAGPSLGELVDLVAHGGSVAIDQES